MNDLDKLAIKYGADKWGKHHYTPVYYDLFKDKRESVKKVLEIGVAEGASLFMWRDFFPNAVIYGAEIDMQRVVAMHKEDRIEVMQCDQSLKEDLEFLIESYGSDIDLIVDDGSHNPEHQVFTALILLPLLKKGVVYIIEDVADETIFNDLFNSNMEWQGSLRMIKVGKRYDDRLIIIKK